MKTVLLLLASLGTAVGAETINFDDAAAGSPPPGWRATLTGKGEPKWTIEKDDTAPSKPNVLKQSGEATFPVCIKDGTSIQNGYVEVKFKPVSGKVDQAGVPQCQIAGELQPQIPVRHQRSGQSSEDENQICGRLEPLQADR